MPAKKKRRRIARSEASIEAAACRKINKTGCVAKKFATMFTRADPDRIIFCPLKGSGHTYFIEFKRPGEDPTAQQEKAHRKLRRMGYSVYVCRSVEEAVTVHNLELAEIGLRTLRTLRRAA